MLTDRKCQSRSCGRETQPQVYGSPSLCKYVDVGRQKAMLLAYRTVLQPRPQPGEVSQLALHVDSPKSSRSAVTNTRLNSHTWNSHVQAHKIAEDKIRDSKRRVPMDVLQKLIGHSTDNISLSKTHALKVTTISPIVADCRMNVTTRGLVSVAKTNNVVSKDHKGLHELQIVNKICSKKCSNSFSVEKTGDKVAKNKLDSLARMVPDVLLSSHAVSTNKSYKRFFSKWEEWASSLKIRVLPAEDYFVGLFLIHLGTSSSRLLTLGRHYLQLLGATEWLAWNLIAIRNS
jgi:hypothetical protein